MTIIRQCANCSKEGKNFYCSNCTKSADYFDVYKYEDNNNRISTGKMIGRIKAYTWHDAIEYVKNSLFHDRTRKFNIDCEKDFAYVEEENINSTITGDRNKEKETMLGFKLYLNNEEEEEDKSESSLKGENFWDLTTTITNNNISTDIPNTSNNEQQTVASAIEPDPRNQLTTYTPTMITRSNKEQKQEEEEEEEEENTLADKS
jgi:hypothetical protein